MELKNVSPGVLVIENASIFHFAVWLRNRMNAYYQCDARKHTGCKVTSAVTSLTYESEYNTPRFRYVLSTFLELVL